MPRSYSGRLSGSPLPHSDLAVPRSQLSIQAWLTRCDHWSVPRSARARTARCVSSGDVSKNPELGFALSVLGKVAWHERQFNEAESLLRRSIAAWLVSVGPRHETYGSGIAALASFLSPTKPEEADQLFRQALSILRRSSALTTDTQHPQRCFTPSTWSHTAERLRQRR